MANRLAQEPSLYLQQHADNPVDWYPWGEEALQKAQAEDKPLLVSIGYSACHWCHVMAHESFENEAIAGIMNRHFVCIKVDREELPALDQVYMESVQMMNGHGGWPLNVFCLPDGRPFAGGTYFPAEDKGQGMVPWPQLLMRVADYYQREKSELVNNAEAILGNLQSSNMPIDFSGDHPNAETFITAARTLSDNHDDQYGGFGEAPKFPPSMTLDFLLSLRATRTVEEQTPELSKRIDQVVQRTLFGMAHGGIFDQIGGGFARYSVDAVWLIPHFEKMLYDNALLLEIFTKGYRRYRQRLFQAIVEETIAWLEREMRAEGQAFYASIDADSEGEEGKFYVWTPEQVKEVLGEEIGRAFCDNYVITEKGTFEHGASNPALGVSSFEDREKFQPFRQKLLQAREERIRPTTDTKQLSSWNGLLLRGLVEAAFTFNRLDWMQTALDMAEWLWRTMVDKDGRLRAVHYAQGIRNVGTLDDYANLTQGILTLAGKVDWLSPGVSTTWIQRAQKLTEKVLLHFKDSAGPGFYTTADDATNMISRKKDWFDNATPAGNSSMVHVFSQLHALTGEERYRDALSELMTAYPGLAARVPSAVGHALSGLIQDLTGICVVKIRGVDSIQPLRDALVERPWRQVFIQHVDDPRQPEGYQLCVGAQCLEPTQDVATVAEQI